MPESNHPDQLIVFPTDLSRTTSTIFIMNDACLGRVATKTEITSES